MSNMKDYLIYFAWFGGRGTIITQWYKTFWKRFGHDFKLTDYIMVFTINESY